MKREGSHVKSGKMYTDSFAGDPPFLPDVSGQDVNESCNGRRNADRTSALFIVHSVGWKLRVPRDEFEHSEEYPSHSNRIVRLDVIGVIL